MLKPSSTTGINYKVPSTVREGVLPFNAGNYVRKTTEKLIGIWKQPKQSVEITRIRV